MTIQLDYLPKWQGVGPCVEYPAVMYPGSDETTLRLARAICRSCPVLRSCRRWVLSLPHHADPGGVVGGLTRAERGRGIEGDVDGKPCTRCGELKPFTEFSLVALGGTKLRSHCKTCCAQATRDANAARHLAVVDALPDEPHKSCPRCKTTRGVSRFYPNAKNSDGLAAWCKSCFQSLKGNE